jgi:eukaryotic-like serine/threonine-protein kinase
LKAARQFLIATLVTAFTAQAASPTILSPSPRHSGTVIAILVRPDDATSKSLAAEYARTVIHLLGGVERLAVVPRSSVLQAEGTKAAPAEVGGGLAARYVLAANVRVNDGALEILAELIDSTTETRCWKKLYRSTIVAAAPIAATIAHETSRALGLEFVEQNARERDVVTLSVAAWEHYVRGREALDTLTDASLANAIAHLERAIAADPGFVSAQVALATAHIALGYNFRNPRLHFEKARRSLTEIAHQGEPLVEAVVDDAVLKYYYEWNWAAAARGAAFTTRHDSSAVETHACFLHCAQTSGRIEEGLQQIAAAHQAHPDSPAIRAELPCAAYYGGNFAEAERESRSALKSDPENPLLYWSLARALAQQSHFDAALSELKTAQSKPGGDWGGILAEIAYINGRQNRGLEARDVIAQLRAREKSEYVDHYLYAMAFAGLGESVDVFRHLEQAATDRSTWIPSLPLDPKFSALRSDPRYKTLVRTLKLEPQ